eukprot:scaffold530_cov148-Skeletonema_marinoi.AAC.3
MVIIASSTSTTASSLLGRMGNRLLHSKTHHSLPRYVSSSPSVASLHRTLQPSSHNNNLSINPTTSIRICNGCLFSTRAMTSLTSLPSSLYEHNKSYRSTISLSSLSGQQQTHHRQFASKRKQKGRNNKAQKIDENAPLLNEHLVAELFNEINKKEGGAAKVSPDTFEVRLIIDVGFDGKKGSDDEDNNNSNLSPSSTPNNESRVVTLNEAINISHDLSLDLMEVTLKQDPPVIKAVDYDKWLYDQKKKLSKKENKKGSDAGGAISDRPLKEFKFRAGIADHDLERKTNNMLKYLGKGHAIRVTLTARQRSLKEDAQAISTTLDRVKELIGDKAVEVRGMKANDRLSYGNLLFHPNKGS